MADDGDAGALVTRRSTSTTPPPLPPLLPPPPPAPKTFFPINGLPTELLVTIVALAAQ